jgi:hypothetical protein
MGMQPYIICDKEFSLSLFLFLSADTQNCRYKSNMADELAMAYPETLHVIVVWEIALCFWDKMSWSCPAVPVVAASPDSIICSNQL